MPVLVSFLIKERNTCDTQDFSEIVVNHGGEGRNSSTNIFSSSPANPSMKGWYIHSYIPPFKVCVEVSFLSRSHGEWGRC